MPGFSCCCFVVFVRGGRAIAPNQSEPKKKKNKNSFGTSKWLNRNTAESMSRKDRIREKTAASKMKHQWSINPRLEKVTGNDRSQPKKTRKQKNK
jgi:hypothetical protein